MIESSPIERQHTQEVKKCIHCGESSGPWHTTNGCKKCRRDYMMRYRAEYALREGMAERFCGYSAKYRGTEKGAENTKKRNALPESRAAMRAWRKTGVGRQLSEECRRKRESLKRRSNTDGLTPTKLREIRWGSVRCAYCGGVFVFGQMRTLDHVQPLCRNGAHTLRNLVVCCLPCNVRKARTPALEWFAEIGRTLDFEMVEP